MNDISLAGMGTDGAKWATAFKQIVKGEPNEETLRAWFSNAIETAIAPLQSALIRVCDIAGYIECPCSTKERLSGHRTDCLWGEHKSEIAQLRKLAEPSQDIPWKDRDAFLDSLPQQDLKDVLADVAHTLLILSNGNSNGLSHGFESYSLESRLMHHQARNCLARLESFRRKESKDE